MKTWLIVIACFAAGYWVIAKLLSANDKQPFRDAMSDPESAPAANEGGTLSPETPASLANWHIILGVERNASLDDARVAYQRQMSLYHPDKVSTLGEEIRSVATAKAKQINAAYDIAVRYGTR